MASVIKPIGKVALDRFDGRFAVLPDRPAPVAKRDPWDVRLANRLARIGVAGFRWWNFIVSLGWLHWVCVRTPKYYPMGRSLVFAHLWGPASKAEKSSRKAACSVCPYRYDYKQQEYCRGDNGGRGCGCGHWRGSRLEHKVGLAGFKCPQGRFGYGGIRRLLAIARKA